MENRNTLYYSAENIIQIDGNCSDSNVYEQNNEKNEEIHFILVYKTTENPTKIMKRKYFEKQLEEVGLILNYEQEDKNLVFVKIYAPHNVLCHYCEIMKLRMPMKKISGLNDDINIEINKLKKVAQNVFNYICVNLFETNYLDKHVKWTAEFSTKKDYLFDLDNENFFSMSDKSLIINFILERGKFNDNPQDVGIKKLINECVYEAYYPLHDGNEQDENSQRHMFLKEWASITKIYKSQPLNDIKNYFGVKFTLYFTWLGFYTGMLIPASIVGILCMLYGFITLSSDNLVKDVCNNKTDIIMCPTCDKYCDYWYITEACTYAKVTHLFDNYGTISFGFFMSVWSALFVEFWKRYSAGIAHRWGLSDFDLDAQHPRPEYLAKFANFKKKVNVITNQEEPVVPFFRVKLPAMILSFSLAIFWVFLALGAVFAVVIYRMAGAATDIIFDKYDTFSPFFVPLTAGIINLTIITLLNYYYHKIAYFLTKYEYHRTQLEFDDSLTIKIYMFQFVNFYSSLFYIAFIKGKFIGYPHKYNRIFGFRQEECSLGGCMMELFLQLAIIMIGKQALNAIIETALPQICSLVRKNKSTHDSVIFRSKQWVSDYYLTEWDSKGMFSEYLEIVIQYGFTTLFVVAFPLAPLFALINNVFEIRSDAKKYVKYYRRPIAQRIKDIGIWFPIIEVLGKIAIVSNAFIIAFSSNYIPLMVYSALNPDLQDSGFLNASLSYFDINDFSEDSRPNVTKFNITSCRYADYRKPYWSKNKYNTSQAYWHVLAARLAFIVVYQNFVGFIVMVVQSVIPDIPKKLREQIKREALRINNIIIEEEAKRMSTKKKLSKL